MKKIILVQPKNNALETTYAPLGLLSLAAYIRNSYEVKIVDLRFFSSKYLLDLIKKDRPIAVGFSMLTGSCIKQIISLSQEIKNKYPKIKTIVGGIHPTFFPKQTLANPYLDFVVVNEGEKTLGELLQAMDNHTDQAAIDNLGWKDEQGRLRLNQLNNKFLDLNRLPRPAWDLIEVEPYIKKLSTRQGERAINFYTSKGCPFPCSFCYNLNFNQRKWRARSAEKAVQELEFLYQKHKVNYFIVHDDNFVVDRERALRFARLIIERGIKIKYSIDARVDYFDYKFLKKLKESGLAEIRVGCESGSDRILRDIVQKQITTAQTVKAIEIAKKLNIRVLLSFVIGWPTETIKERQATINFIFKLQKIYPQVWIYPLWIYVPYPGTTLFSQALKMGFRAPQSLADWGNYFWGKAHIPWLKKQKEYEMIHDLSPFAWYNKTLATLPDKSARSILKFIFVKTFKPFILFRFKHNFWLWPLEAKLALLLKNFLQKAGGKEKGPASH